ncbi:MAG: energy transducer TonB [Bauldia sp.]|nr:MAG: energy transducer TonB [Bauldia sp.]
MFDCKTSGRSKFTIYHAFTVSLALHSAVGLPFVLHGAPPPPEDQSTLVFELNGLVADQQTELQTQRQTQGETKRAEADRTKSDEQQKRVEPDDDGASSARPTKSRAAASAGSPGSESSGVEQQQIAQTIKREETEIDRLEAYIRLLSKKVQSRLVYPEEGRHAGLQGAATVSFAILRTGQIRPETLRIVESSGQPKLDASALKTVRSSAPFDPPPKEMTVAIAVAFGRKR